MVASHHRGAARHHRVRSESRSAAAGSQRPAAPYLVDGICLPDWLAAPEECWLRQPPDVAFRVMRGDQDDLAPPEHLSTEGDVRRVALNAIAHGSSYRSPFLHACLSLDCALEWYKNARRKDPRCYLRRVDLRLLHPSQIIYVSTPAQQRRLWPAEWQDKNRQWFEDMVHKHPKDHPPTILAEKYSEILIVARGALPHDVFKTAAVIPPSSAGGRAASCVRAR